MAEAPEPVDVVDTSWSNALLTEAELGIPLEQIGKREFQGWKLLMQMLTFRV